MLPSFAASERDQMKAGNDSLIDLICTTMDKNMDKVGEVAADGAPSFLPPLRSSLTASYPPPPAPVPIAPFPRVGWYATRHIFSIPEEVQQLIMEEIAAGATQGTPGKRAKTSASASPSAGADSSSDSTTSIPKSVDDLPSKEDTLKLDQELMELRNKLRSVKKNGHQLKAAAEKVSMDRREGKAEDLGGAPSHSRLPPFPTPSPPRIPPLTHSIQHRTRPTAPGSGREGHQEL